MARSDSGYKRSAARLMDRNGDDCTIRRPVKLERFDGAAITSLVLKTQAEAGATSLVLELADSERLKGSLDARVVLVLASVNYTVQSAADADKASRQITVTVSPAVAAQALVGAVVTVPESVTWSTRYWEDQVGAFSTSGFDAGSRVATVERGDLTIELQGGTAGDYLDVGGANIGRVVQVTESDPGGWEARIE